MTANLAILVVANVLTAACYFIISTLVALSLWHGRRQGVNALGLAVLGIFLTCGVHHAFHAEHALLDPVTYARFADWHLVFADVAMFVPALGFLSLRRRYGLLAKGEGVILDYEREIGRQRRERIAIVDAMLDALFTIDPDGRVVSANRYASELLGRAPAELAGRRFADLFVDPDGAAVGLTQALAGDLLGYEAELRAADGAAIAVSLNARTATDAGHQVQAVIVVARDIRRQKAMEAELRAYSGRLEELVEQRTSELRQANQELDAFAYSISHDLRAPLRTITGFAEAIVEDYTDRLDDEGRDYLRRIQAGVRRMAALIDDLLSFSRLARRDLAARPVDLNETIRTVLDDFGAEIAQRQVRVEVAPLPSVVCDAGVIGQVFQNMLSNALKYTRPTPEPAIAIGWEPAGDAVRLWVRDNGIGFDMRYHDQIWQVFRRLHPPDEFEGTGIGLALVRRIVERHNGLAWAESAGAGLGATFYVQLPRDGVANQPAVERPGSGLALAPAAGAAG